MTLQPTIKTLEYRVTDMPTVKINEVVSWLEVQGRGLIVFYHRESGRYMSVPLDGFDQTGLSASKIRHSSVDRAAEQVAGSILNDPAWVRLPTPIQINEHRIREMFCEQVADPEAKRHLKGAIRGRINDERFRLRLFTYGQEEAWTRFYKNMLERVATNWCRLNNLETDA